MPKKPKAKFEAETKAAPRYNSMQKSLPYLRNSGLKRSASRDARLSRVGGFLDELFIEYHQRHLLISDPLEFVHLYTDPFDQEAVALLAALLAYGNVKQVRKSVADALNRISRLSSSPSEFVRNLHGISGSALGGKDGVATFRAQAERELDSFVHRFNRGEDLFLLLKLLSESWIRFGSLGAHFLSHQNAHEDISEPMARLIADWRGWVKAGASRPKHDSFQYLLTSPADGSCCKRWCMLLRWMGRKDEIDPGLWTQSSPLSHTFPEGKALSASQLILPLDTHTGRISQYLGLTKRKTLDWKAAVEITQNLAVCDPQDPTRYDFAISRLGILDVCQRRFRKEICVECQLVTVCKFGQRIKTAPILTKKGAQ